MMHEVFVCFGSKLLTYNSTTIDTEQLQYFPVTHLIIAADATCVQLKVQPPFCSTDLSSNSSPPRTHSSPRDKKNICVLSRGYSKKNNREASVQWRQQGKCNWRGRSDKRRLAWFLSRIKDSVCMCVFTWISFSFSNVRSACVASPKGHITA